MLKKTTLVVANIPPFGFYLFFLFFCVKSFISEMSAGPLLFICVLYYKLYPELRAGGKTPRCVGRPVGGISLVAYVRIIIYLLYIK